MNISGSVGFTLLKHKILDKYILLLADVHDGVSYCEDESIYIDKWLMNKGMKYSNDILLEEISRENINKLQELWPSSPHTQNLKNLSIKNKKIKLIDIRHLLIPFSWELCRTNVAMGKTILKKYLEILNSFFNLRKTQLMMNYVLPEILKLKEKQDFKVSLITHFNEIKNLYLEFISENKSLMDTDLLTIQQNNEGVLEKINNLLSLIMEWYVILLIHNNDKNIIIHIGLAHSDRILDILNKVYQFNIHIQNGINKMEDTYKPLHSCININNTINNIF